MQFIALDRAGRLEGLGRHCVLRKLHMKSTCMQPFLAKSFRFSSSQSTCLEPLRKLHSHVRPQEEHKGHDGWDLVGKDADV